MGYTKLFSDIVASTIWDEDNETRIVWVTMLALKDRHHFVRATENYLALASRVPVESLRRAIGKLSGPDPHSRTRDHDGRRIEATDGGWMILNGEKYRKMLSETERREYQRQKQAEYRKRKKQVAHAGACEGAREAINEGLNGN